MSANLHSDADASACGGANGWQSFTTLMELTKATFVPREITSAVGSQFKIRATVTPDLSVVQIFELSQIA